MEVYTFNHYVLIRRGQVCSYGKRLIKIRSNVVILSVLQVILNEQSNYPRK